MQITYTEVDGIQYPDLKMQTQETESLGKYGQMALEYLKENYKSRYNTLKRFGMLNLKMMEVNERAYQMEETIMNYYLKKNLPQNSESTMEIWKIREQAKSKAKELVIKELVNTYH